MLNTIAFSIIIIAILFSLILIIRNEQKHKKHMKKIDDFNIKIINSRNVDELINVFNENKLRKKL